MKIRTYTQSTFRVSKSSTVWITHVDDIGDKCPSLLHIQSLQVGHDSSDSLLHCRLKNSGTNKSTTTVQRTPLNTQESQLINTPFLELWTQRAKLTCLFSTTQDSSVGVWGEEVWLQKADSVTAGRSEPPPTRCHSETQELWGFFRLQNGVSWLSWG